MGSVHPHLAGRRPPAQNIDLGLLIRRSRERVEQALPGSTLSTPSSNWERICSVKAPPPIHRAILSAARPGSDCVRSTVLVDTGFLIALFDGTDTLHESAKQMLAALVRDRRTALVSVWPTIVETSFFLDPAASARCFSGSSAAPCACAPSRSAT